MISGYILMLSPDKVYLGGQSLEDYLNNTEDEFFSIKIRENPFSTILIHSQKSLSRNNLPEVLNLFVNYFCDIESNNP